jgi:hypothetical protein
MGRQRAARVVRGQRLLQLALLHYPELTRQSVELDLEGVDTQLPPAVIAELDARFASSAAGASRGGGH